MKACLRVARLWEDETLAEIEVAVCDGRSTYVHSQYVGVGEIGEWAASLQAFGTRVRGDLLETRLGGEPTFVAPSATFDARFQFDLGGRLSVATHQRSVPMAFADAPFVPGATMRLQSEPALLDRFVDELHELAAGRRDEAMLECV